MSDNTTATGDLAAQYAAQVIGDLERNIKEQERIGAEIVTLQEQLATLQQDHSVLVNMQQALGINAADAQPTPAAAPAATAVPAPRGKAAPGSGEKKTRARKPAAAPKKSTVTAKKSAAAAAPKKSTTAPGRQKAAKVTADKPQPKAAAADKAAQPTLVDLVHDHLSAQREPRSAAEITTTLDQAHPDRRIKTTVVRTTLENLVAKGRAQRSKQGSSVFYTTPDRAPGAEARSEAKSDTGAEAQSEPAGQNAAG
ncbi:hypothetical protein [Streptomyces cadmiisoli]|uniref:Regulatory protein n=1 Tax=Streptomyces cadmiisoli TaxID=2184053 RepID=A0A2Z4IVB6_9ACTN|nr:hypothetical protein [Streptomyces cadmiisoli]AWW36103.1 hypothetical protein DN051_05170 [Streptomyces cadmiisoli]